MLYFLSVIAVIAQIIGASYASAQDTQSGIPSYDEAQAEPWMATPTCQTYPEWTGQQVDTIDLSILGDRPHRILHPDSMATMDYSPDRLNIHTTDDGIIITQDCG